MSTLGNAPTWGSQWQSLIMQNADRWNLAYIQKTTLPYEDNYLDLDPTVQDPLSFPVCRITADVKANDKQIGTFMQVSSAKIATIRASSLYDDSKRRREESTVF